jgi:hypothetical protein
MRFGCDTIAEGSGFCGLRRQFEFPVERTSYGCVQKGLGPHAEIQRSRETRHAGSVAAWQSVTRPDGARGGRLWHKLSVQ